MKPSYLNLPVKKVSGVRWRKYIHLVLHFFTDMRKITLAIAVVKSGRGASVFSVRTDDSSATQYFQFYGYLSQQQNMLQDFVRTYSYQRAIVNNPNDFKVCNTIF